MTTCSLYGFITSLAGAFLTLILYLTGFHSSESKLAVAGYLSMALMPLIAIVCISLGVRARRDETPADQEFGYGRALGAGTLIAVISSFLSSIFGYIYVSFVNPGIIDLEISQQIHKVEASGVSGADLDRAEKGIRMFMGAIPQTIVGLIMGIVFGFLIAVVVAVFLKRSAVQPPKV